MLKIKIGNQVALFDDDFFLPRKLRIDKGYVRTSWQGSEIRVHRLIANARVDEQVDHINGDKLDNRRSNLRVCSHAQNAYNHPGKKNTASRYKGVTRNTKGWIARIQKDGRQYNLGTFPTEEAAAKQYDNHALALFGEFARLNLPQD